MVKHLPATQGTRVQSLEQEDPLEKEMATHSSTTAWKIPWMEEPGGAYSPWGCKESDKTELSRFLSYNDFRDRIMLCATQDLGLLLWEGKDAWKKFQV